MALVLTKGGSISLEKQTPGITNFEIGAGWDISGKKEDFDIDIQAFMLGENGLLLSEEHVIFYNNKRSPDNSISLSGDNLTGAGTGDDETIIIDLTKVPLSCTKIEFTATIHEAITRKQNFGQINNSFIHVLDEKSKNELVRYDLTEDFSSDTFIITAVLYRHNGEWKFKAIGEGYSRTLEEHINLMLSN